MLIIAVFLACWDVKKHEAKQQLFGTLKIGSSTKTTTHLSMPTTHDTYDVVFTKDVTIVSFATSSVTNNTHQHKPKIKQPC